MKRCTGDRYRFAGGAALRAAGPAPDPAVFFPPPDLPGIELEPLRVISDADSPDPETRPELEMDLKMLSPL